MDRSVTAKMGIKPDHKVLVVTGTTAVVAATDPSSPADQSRKPDHIILFTIIGAALNDAFPKYRDMLAQSGKLWVTWPKGGKLGTDLTIKEVIRIGYNHGLVESTNLRIDDTWTALKFTRPKPGKVYQNSYGKLPGTGIL